MDTTQSLPTARDAVLPNPEGPLGPMPIWMGHKVEFVPVSRLKPYPGNARTHSRKQIKQIVESVRRFGFTSPPLVDDKDIIIAGHGRVAAAKQLELATIPILRLSHLSAAEKRAYVLADNKLAQPAGWDRELLAIELQGLIDLDIEVEFSGFQMGEIDIILDVAREANGESPGREDECDEPLMGRTVSRLGDLWTLGNHRLLCGNALDSTAFDVLLEGKKAEFVFTDPPYNVPIDGHVGGKGSVHHREFAMASGEMSQEEFTGFLTDVFQSPDPTQGARTITVAETLDRAAKKLESDPAVLPAVVVGAARSGGIAVKHAHHHRLAFLDGLGTRVLHIANQSVDLGRNAIRRGHVLERWYAHGHQDRDEGDDNHHLEDREARAIALAGVHFQPCFHAGKTTQASLRETG